MSIQYQAEYFLNAYHVLRDNNKAAITKLEKAQVRTESASLGIEMRITPGIDIVCLAFAVELYMKYLHSVIHDKAPRGHDILKLFQKLPENIQKDIFVSESIRQNPFFTRGDIFSPIVNQSSYTAYDGFLDNIKAVSDGFEKWRYSHESASLKYNTSFALAFIEAVKTVANNLTKNRNSSG